MSRWAVLLSLLSFPAYRARAIELPGFFKKSGDGLEEVLQAPCGPGGLAVTPGGEYIIACHQFFDPVYAVMRCNEDGIWEPFPNMEMNTPGSGSPVVLDSVLGIRCDPKGIVWILDNGRRSERPPKLVAWDSNRNRLHQVIQLAPPAVLKTSFVRDLALDPEEPFVYISDPANGDDAALIIVDLRTNLARRVLQGHNAVQPEPGMNFQLDGRIVAAKSPDGRNVQPLAGVSPLAIDRKGTWLYFGPTVGATLFRIRTEYLRDDSLHPKTLAAQVQGFSPKNIGDSIAVDAKGNVYFADVQSGAIGYVTPAEKYLKYHLLVEDSRLMWPGGLTLTPDGRLHFFSNQLHRTPIFNDGKNTSSPPFEIFRIKGATTTSKFWSLKGG